MKLCPCRLLARMKPRNHTDRLLALWIGLCLATLLPVVLMMLGGCLVPLEDAQLRLLAGHPFYLGAEEAQISLLSPLAAFCLCLLLTFWLAAIFVREPSLARRSQVAALAAVAVALPGLMCVLWGGVLYVVAPLASIAILWALAVPLAALWRARHVSACSRS